MLTSVVRPPAPVIVVGGGDGGVGVTVPSSLPGIAVPTPVPVHGVGIDRVAVLGFVANAVYRFPVTPPES